MNALTQYTFWDEDELEKATLKRIEYAKTLYEAQVQKVKKEEYIKNVLLQDYVNQIKEHRSRYDLINIFSKAQDEIGKRLKKDRPHYETIKRLLMEDFLNNDKTFKLVSIVCGGYEGYYWRFEFTGYGKTSFIEIPMMSRIAPDNVEYANYGMFVFGVYDSDSCYRSLIRSYSIKDISEFIKEYFSKCGDTEG